MDFRFRPEGTQPYSSFSSSSSSRDDSYLTRQALRVGLRTGDIEDLMKSETGREAFQRELEKERIREEVIAQEIIRLQEEVRRNLTMERDLALRRAERIPMVAPTLARPLGGFGFEERMPHLPAPVVRLKDGNFAPRLSFQRPLDSERGRITERFHANPATSRYYS